MFIPDSELERFREVIRSFSSATATAHDRIPPRIINELDDDT